MRLTRRRGGKGMDLVLTVNNLVPMAASRQARQFDAWFSASRNQRLLTVGLPSRRGSKCVALVNNAGAVVAPEK